MTNTKESPSNEQDSRTRSIRRLRMFRIPVMVGLAILAFETARIPLMARHNAGNDTEAVAQRENQTPIEDQDQAPVQDATETAAENPARGDTLGQATEVAASEPGDLSGQQDAEPDQFHNLRDGDTTAAVQLAQQAKSAVLAELNSLSENLQRAVGSAASELGNRKPVDTDVVDTEATGEPPEAAAAGDVAVSGNTARSRDELVLVNSLSTGVEIFFLVDGKVESLAAGESRRYDRADARTIQFHRGGDFGEAEIQLTAGVYAFDLTSSGWDLRPQAGDAP